MEKEAVLKTNNFCPVNPQEDISHLNFQNAFVSAIHRQEAQGPLWPHSVGKHLIQGLKGKGD